MKIAAVAALLAFMCVSCGFNQEKNSQKVVERYFSENRTLLSNDVKHYVIIPILGCGGCLDKTIKFIESREESFSANQKANCIVFTHFPSQKELKRHVGNLNLEDLNVILDQTDAYFVDFEDNEYPIVLNVENGSAISADIYSPYNNILIKLDADL